MKVDELLVSYTTEEIKVQTIGMKNILFSKKIVQLYDWEYLKNSFAISYFDNK